MPMTPIDPRLTGIPSIGELPWGSHFGVFHASSAELLEILVPFVKAGLECNEVCSWEVRPPLTVDEVRNALARAVPGFETYAALGQIDLASPPEEPAPCPDDEALASQLDRAILSGFDGLRLVAQAGGCTSARGFAAAESLGRLNVIAAFPYPREALGVVELMQRVQDHRFALVRNSGRWEVLKGSGAHTVAALRRSEDRLRSLFRNMSEGFAYHRIVRDDRGRPCDYVFLDVNPAFERLTGLAAHDILGKRVTQVLPGIEADPTDWIGKFGRVALTGEPLQFESSLLDRLFEVSAFSSQKGYFAVTFADITGRKRAEAQRRASEARFKLLSDSASLLLSTDDPQGVVSKLCREVMQHLDCQAFFNYLAEPGGGKLHLNACEGVPEEEARRIQRLDFGVAVCGCVARDRQRMIAEDIQRSSDRRTELVRSYGIQAYCCHPLMAEGRLLGTLSFGTRTRTRFSDDDVALMKTVADQVAVAMERIEAQRALHDANARLQEADRRKDEFLAVLSHELRNPLAPIQNSVFILDRGAPGGEQAKRSLEVIRRQVGHLSRLVDDLLDVTRIARGKIRLQRQRVDVVDLVRRTVEDYRASFCDGGVDLDAHLPETALWADADSTRLAQIVGNLLGNALKFTPRDGRVELFLRDERGAATLRVRDTGVGIAPEVIERLFRPFAQAEQTLDRSRGGLGLGLALVKGLAELHGGGVAAASEGLGRGAEFTVTLPLVHAPQPVASPPHLRPLPRYRVLVIEDNVDSADSLKEVLELWGHEVEVAHEGPAGIAVARRFRPEFVLCDIGLPGMSGHAVARALRAEPSLAKACLVALTGYASPDDLQRATASGFHRHLAKPASLEALHALLAAREPGLRVVRGT